MALRTVTAPADDQAEGPVHQHRIKPADQQVYATLVRGKTYDLMLPADGRYHQGLRFERGVPVQVTPEQRAYLEEHGVDDVTERTLDEASGKESVIGVRRTKFKFSSGEAAA